MPSAPIFQDVRAEIPRSGPSAIRMSGEAFSSNSEMLLSELSGLRKKIRRVDKRGQTPPTAKTGALTINGQQERQDRGTGPA